MGQGLRLALSKGSIGIGVSFPSLEDRNRLSFQNVLCFPEYETRDKVQKPRDSGLFSLVYRKEYATHISLNGYNYYP
jgi:hypothetical protein